MKTSPVIFTVKAGALAIAVHKYEDGRYGFEYTPPGKERVRVRRRARQAAIDEAQKLVNTSGTMHLLSISAEEYAEFLKWRATRKRAATVEEMVGRFLDSKKTKGLSKKHLDDLEGTLTPFSEITTPIANLTREDVETWLNKRKTGPRRWNNQLAHIVSLLRFARRDGALSYEPHPVEHIERRKVKLTVETYSVAEMARMLKATAGGDRVFVVLCGLCGLRPNEVRPEHSSHKPALTWEAFDWRRKVIDVPANISKVGERRFVPISDAAMSFLADYHDKKGECVPLRGSKTIATRIAKASWVTWKPDALRHTYASNRLAILKDMGKLATEMGNSPTMIKRHYLDLRHEDEAERWFGLRPDNLRLLAHIGTKKTKLPPSTKEKGERRERESNPLIPL